MQLTTGVPVVSELPESIEDTGRLLGCGSYGEVWLGHDRDADRPVALKYLLPHLVHDDESREQLCREAERMARLDGDHVPKVFALVDSGSKLCIVMEYVAGETLEKHLRFRGPLAPEECCRLGAELADVVASAHRADVVHCDIDPANVMLTDDEQVCLLDWGASVSGLSDGPVKVESVTGTVPYIAPEHLLEGVVRPEGDIYSLGATLFCAASGRPPIQTKNEVELGLKLTGDGPASLRRVRPDVPLRLCSAIDGTQAVDPEARPSLPEFEEALLAA